MVKAVVVIYFALVVVLDFRVTAKSKKPNEIWIYSVCLFFSFAVLFLRSLDIAVPGPTHIIVDVLKKLSLIE